jgi:D-sedoheptulose 7-phosphate isomerase
MKSIIEHEFNEHIKTSLQTLRSLSKPIEGAAKMCVDSLRKGGKIILIGNGGSAADAQHIAAELIGRYKLERNGIAAIALTTDSSVMTSIANDFGYEEVFKRQINTLANKTDVLIGISTGGTSKNIINAIHAANLIGCNTIGFSGKDGGQFNDICNSNLVVVSDDTPRIQEMHILIGHTICHLIEQELNSD